VTARVRIGTRGSRLARAQAEWVRARLAELHPGADPELVIIRTSGDRFLDVPLSTVGGKGLFVKEIEEALVRGDVDLAVHSLKDLPLALADGLVIGAVPKREDPRDVVITRAAGGLASLAAGARVGTSSLRRTALVRARRPDLDVVALRGNVDTRLEKLARGEIDAIVLAAAGLARLELAPDHVEPCDPEWFVPAIGQGALAIECRDDEVRSLVAELDDPTSRDAVAAERGFLAAVSGSCVTPLGAWATIAGGALHLRGLIADPDGTRIVRGAADGARHDAERIGSDLGRQLLGEGGAEILAELGAA
jgi:hydroxymethylbilane synthase